MVPTGLKELDRLVIHYGIRSVQPVYQFPPRNKELDKLYGLSRTFLLHTDAPVSIRDMINDFASLSEVSYAEPNGILKTFGVANDSLFSNQWALRNSGQAVAVNGTVVGLRDSDIDMPEAWEVSTGSNAVILSIIDSGVDYNHPEFAGRIVAGFDFVNNDADPMDDNGHGTACAGIAAASGNNGQGIAGIDWNCRIMPVKVFDAAGSGTDAWVANGFIFAADNGASVLSFSGGGAHSLTLQNAIDYAYSLDAVIVAARGNNNNTTPLYPASYSNVIAVAALSPCDERKSGTSCDGENWWGSSFGADVDVIAPGVRIHTTDILGAGGFSGGDYYNTFNGTSAATPHVSGVAAIIRSLRPNFTTNDVRIILQQSTIDIGAPGFDYETGFGRLNAFKALVKTAGIRLAAAPDSIVYAPVGVGDSLVEYVKIFNNAAISKTILFTTTDNAFFTNPSSLVLAPGEMREVEVWFAPSVSGNFSTLLTGDVGDTTVFISLSGSGINLPDIAVNPSSLNFNLLSGDSASSLITINNVGTADLSWTITGISGSPGTKVNYPPSYYETIVPKGVSDPRRGDPVQENFGGPDLYGYIWRDSDDPNGPIFSWTDIRTTGTLVTGLGDDNYVGPFPLGFTFNYYGTDYTQFYIGSNGFVGFGPPNAYNQYNNIPIPSTSDPDNILAWSWDDFRPINGTVYYQTIGSQLIVQFVDYEDFSGTGQINAQVVLDANGSIRFQYLSLLGSYDGTSSTIGIENQTGNDGLQVSFNALYLHDSLAIEFVHSQWLSANPLTGIVPPGGNQNVTVTANTTGLLTGQYGITMNIDNNDPDENPTPVPVTLNVDAQLVTFSVNMNLYQSVGYFNPQVGDYVTVRGNFNGWVDSTAYQLNDIGGGIYQGIFPQYGNPGDTVLYKFFIHTGDGRVIPNGGWEDSVDVYGGVNGYRGFLLTGSDKILPTVYFNNNSQGFPGNLVLPDSLIVTVTQGVNTTAALTIQNTGVMDLQWELFTALPSVSFSANNVGIKPRHDLQPDELLPALVSTSLNTTPVPVPFADDFEDGNFNGWVDDGGTGIKEVTNTTAASGLYSFHYQYTGANGHYHGIHRDFNPGSQPNYIGFYVRSGSNFLSDTYVVIYNTAHNAEIITFFARSTGYFYVNADVGGSLSVPYNPLQWYHIEFKDINWTNKNFDYYVDGQLIQANITFRNAGQVNDMDRIYLYNFHSGSEGWWDNFIIGYEPVSWLTPSPTSGVVTPGGLQNVTVDINAQNLALGTHSADLFTISNDPINSQIQTPVRITVVQNTPPVAINDTSSIIEDIPTTLNVLSNDYDADNDPLTIQSVDTSATLGTVSIDPSFGSILYTPPANFNGTDSLIYTINDGNGATARASVYLTILPVNDSPLVNSPIADVSYAEDSGIHPVVSDLNTVFSDPDPGDVLSFSAASTNPNISATISGTGLQVSSSLNYFGFGNVRVTATDTSGLSVTDTFLVTITPVNDAPVVSGLPDITFPENGSTALNLDPYVNDVDNDTTEITWSAQVVSAQPLSAARIGSKGKGGISPRLILPSDLQVVIDPVTHIAVFTVTPDSSGIFTVVFTGTDPGSLWDDDTLLVTVTPVNQPPVVISPITDVSYAEDSGVHPVVADLNTVFSDPDPGDVLSFSAASSNPNISATISGTGLQASSSLNYFGSGNVRVTATDTSGLSVTDTFLVTITPVNDPPQITGLPDTLRFVIDTTLLIWNYVDDVETPDSLLVYQFVSSNDSVLISYNSPNGMLTLSALAGYTGQATLTVTVSDDSNATAQASMLLLVNPGVSAFSKPVFPNWNLVGLPLDVVNPFYLSLFPNAVPGTLFGWDGSYTVTDTLIPGKGYWLKFPAADTVLVTGFPMDSLTLHLRKGWNLIAGISCDIALTDVIDNNGILIPGTLFGFDGAYYAADSILPGEGYWVNTSDSGWINLSCQAGVPGTMTKQREEQAAFFKGNQDGEYTTIEIWDAAGVIQKLFYLPPEEGISREAFRELLPHYRMPPLPPAGVFDVRFDGDLCLSTGNEMRIRVQTSHFPLTIEITHLNINSRSHLMLEEIRENQVANRFDLPEGQAVVISDPRVQWLTIRKVADIPSNYILYQNYPNPFNSTTHIEYGLPRASRVTIEIFDLLGRRVAVLVQQQQKAGFHQVNFDANRLASGVYLYRLRAGEVRKVRKMLLLK